MKKLLIVTSVLLFCVTSLSGCDLGTYNQRLNERTPPKSKMSDDGAESTESDSDSEGGDTEDE